MSIREKTFLGFFLTITIFVTMTVREKFPARECCLAGNNSKVWSKESYLRVNNRGVAGPIVIEQVEKGIRSELDWPTELG